MTIKQSRDVITLLTVGIILALCGLGGMLAGETGWWAWGLLTFGGSTLGVGFYLNESYLWADNENSPSDQA